MKILVLQIQKDKKLTTYLTGICAQLLREYIWTVMGQGEMLPYWFQYLLTETRHQMIKIFAKQTFP